MRLLLVLLVGCSSPKSNDSPKVERPVTTADATTVATADPVSPDAASAALVVKFEKPAGPMKANDAKLAFVVENAGAADATLDLDQLGSAIFAVEVFDASGKQRYTIPPGMPPQNYQPRRETLAPGASKRFEVTLNVFSPELAAGTYTAKARASTNLTSDVVTFKIR